MPHFRLSLLVFCAGLMSGLFSGLSAQAETRTLTGTVTYRERMALPPEAIVDVRLLDVSRADVPAEVLAQTAFRVQSQVPLGFALTYDDAVIREGHRYTLRAGIRHGDQLLFTTTQAYPVFTEAQQGETEIMVHRTASSVVTPTGRWLAEDIAGAGVIDRLQTVLEIAADGTVSGSGGCNSLHGTAEIAGQEITFGALAVTKKLCSAAVMDQEDRFFAQLARVRSWQIDPTRRKLLLLDESGQTIMVLAQM